MAAAYRDSVAYSTAASSITIDPASPALTYSSGDVLVLFVWGYPTLGAPTGSDLTWTQLSGSPRTQAGPFSSDVQMSAWTAVADASITSFTVSNGANDAIGAVLMSVSGADTTTPVDAVAFASNLFVTVADPTCASISPAGTDSLLVCGCGVFPNSGATTFTPPSGMTEREDFEVFNSFSVATLALSASGATGAKVFTESPAQTGGAGEAWIACSLAIKSAGGGASVPAAVRRSNIALMRAGVR